MDNFWINQESRLNSIPLWIADCVDGYGGNFEDWREYGFIFFRFKPRPKTREDAIREKFPWLPEREIEILAKPTPDELARCNLKYWERELCRLEKKMVTEEDPSRLFFIKDDISRAKRFISEIREEITIY